MPGNCRGFGAEIFVPEGGLAWLAPGTHCGGTGVGGMGRVGSAASNWSLVVSSVSAPAKSSETFSLPYPHLFLCPFLTPFPAISSPFSSPRLYANHKIPKDSG